MKEDHDTVEQVVCKTNLAHDSCALQSCCCVSATMRVCARTATENLCATISRDCAEMHEGQSRIEALVDSYQNATAKCVFFLTAWSIASDCLVKCQHKSQGGSLACFQ